MAEKQKFNDILEEMLDLAGVPLNEQDDEEEQDAEDQADVEVDAEEEDGAADEELQDKWEADITSKGKFKIEWTDSYVWVWYKNQRSEKIAIPPKLRPYRALVSSFLNKIVSWVEEKS